MLYDNDKPLQIRNDKSGLSSFRKRVSTKELLGLVTNMFRQNKIIQIVICNTKYHDLQMNANLPHRSNDLHQHFFWSASFVVTNKGQR